MRHLALALGPALLISATAGPCFAQATSESAVVLFQQSEAEYRAGRYVESAALLRRAYAIEPNPVLLYNLGRTLERAEDLHGAIDAYEAYLTEEIDADDRPVIEARLADLRQQVPPEAGASSAESSELPVQNEPTREAPPVSLVPTAEDQRSTYIMPTVVGGLGLAITGGGIVAGLLALSAHEEAMEDPVHASSLDRQDDAEGLATASGLLLAAGGALLAAGLTWLVVDLLESDAGSSAEVCLGPGSVAIRGSLP